MTWIAWLPLIEQLGIPVAAKLWALMQKGGDPTAEEWKELGDLGQQTPRSQVLDALRRAGVDVESERAKELLKLVPPHPG